MNNAFVFPGIGLGIIASGATRVLPVFFSAAAHAVAGFISDQDLADGILCPPLDQLREVSIAVAKQVGAEAIKAGVAGGGCAFSRFKHNNDPERLNTLIEKMVWNPVYFNAMYGWTGSIALIDLTRRRIRTLSLPPEAYAGHIGGRGLDGMFVRSAATRAWDDEDMPVCLFTGPLTATIAPTSGRCHMMSRSPLTGLVGDASMGGKMGVQLKRAGWDGLPKKDTAKRLGIDRHG